MQTSPTRRFIRKHGIGLRLILLAVALGLVTLVQFGGAGESTGLPFRGTTGVTLPGRPMSIRDQLDVDPALRNIADEYAWTPPVPVDGAVVLYGYMLRGFPPEPPHVLSPRYRAVVSYPDWKVLDLAETGTQAGTDLGKAPLPAPFDTLDYEQFSVTQDEFEGLLKQAIASFLQSRTVDMPPASARRLRDLFPVFARLPLMPRLQREGSAFFSALDNAADR